MDKQPLVIIGDSVPFVTNIKPFVHLNNKDLYLLTDALLADIGKQIQASYHVSSCYQVVGYIDKWRIVVNDGKDLQFDLYDGKQYIYDHS